MKLFVTYCEQCPFLVDKQKGGENTLACRLIGWNEGLVVNMWNYTGQRPKGIVPLKECPLREEYLEIELA